MSILHSLGAEYGIQTVVTEAVDNEMEGNFRGKFRGHDGPYRKAIQKGVISILTQDWVRTNFGPDDGGILDEINSLGEELYTMVGRGEAYTHAAAMVLGVPCLTNDRSAVNTLKRAGSPVAATIFRSFDVLVFGLQIGLIDLPACDAARKLLLKIPSHIPEAFRQCSFEDGLGKFFPRLLDGDKPSCGSATSEDRLDARFWIRKIALAAQG